MAKSMHPRTLYPVPDGVAASIAEIARSVRIGWSARLDLNQHRRIIDPLHSPIVLLAVYVGLRPFSRPNSPYRQSYVLPSDRSRRFFDKATISSKVGRLISEIAPSNCVGLGFGGVPSLIHGRAMHAYRTVSGA